ncbi:MAG: hypothetical protein AB1486_15970 [Planctomycetota bacterium]
MVRERWQRTGPPFTEHVIEMYQYGGAVSCADIDGDTDVITESGGLVWYENNGAR